jgi:hypothetical protein
MDRELLAREAVDRDELGPVMGFDAKPTRPSIWRS